MSALYRTTTALAVFTSTLMCSLPCSAQVTLPEVTFVVRHAEKAPLPGQKDVNVALSQDGRIRAQALANRIQFLLSWYPEKPTVSIYVTEYIRTKETAQPLAARLGVTPKPAINKDTLLTAPNGLINRLKEDKNRIRVVIAHSDTIPAIVNKLTNKKILAENKDLSSFDGLHIITKTPTSVNYTDFRFGAPN